MTSRSNRELVASDWTAHVGSANDLQPNVSYLRWWSATVTRTAVTERNSVEVVVNRAFISAYLLGWRVTISVKMHSWGDGLNHHGSRTEAERSFKTLEGAKEWASKIGALIAQQEGLL